MSLKKPEKFDLKVLANLLLEDLEGNWRYILAFINVVLWTRDEEKVLRLLSEPDISDPKIKAICASLAEWLAAKKGISIPEWAQKIGPSPEASIFCLMKPVVLL